VSKECGIIVGCMEFLSRVIEVLKFNETFPSFAAPSITSYTLRPLFATNYSHTLSTIAPQNPKSFKMSNKNGLIAFTGTDTAIRFTLLLLLTLASLGT
jgi:hypothetical protein